MPIMSTIITKHVNVRTKFKIIGSDYSAQE